MSKSLAHVTRASADMPDETVPTDLGSTLSGLWPAGTVGEPQDEAALVERTLHRNFHWLLFPKKLEEQFVHDMPRSRASGSALGNLVVTLAANLFLVADWIMVPDVFDSALVLRLGVLTPFGLLLMALTMMSISMRVREKLLLTMDVLSASVHVLICTQSESPMAQMYLIGLAIIMLYATSHMRTRFWVAATSSFSVLAIYVLALSQFTVDHWQVTFSMGLLLLATSVFTLYNLYGLEHEERLNYLLTLRHQRMQSELKKANRLLERVSRVDALTQVANRRHFDHFLTHVWERAKRDNATVTVLMLDVDCFKAYNDHFGHPKGDQCLIAVAKAVYNSLRKPGDLLARYGGEEFIAVLSKADLAQGVAAAERVRQAVMALRIEHPKSTVDPWVTVSIGVATLQANLPQTSPQTLMAMADEALYQAKNEGRNRVVTRPKVSEGGAAT